MRSIFLPYPPNDYQPHTTKYPALQARRKAPLVRQGIFRPVCLNNVIKRDIYSKLFEPSPQVRRVASKSQRFNAVIAKYALLSKPRGGKGGGQSAPQDETAEAQ